MFEPDKICLCINQRKILKLHYFANPYIDEDTLGKTNTLQWRGSKQTPDNKIIYTLKKNGHTYRVCFYVTRFQDNVFSRRVENATSDMD